MTNCFEMRCPKCGDETCIDIQAKLWIRVCDDGTDADASENGYHEFDPESPASCAACGHCDTVEEFERAGGAL